MELQEIAKQALTAKGIETVLGVLGAGTTAWLVWYIRKRRIRRLKDIQQDERISDSLKQTAQLTATMETANSVLLAKIEELILKVDKFQERADKVDSINEFKERIMEIGYGLIKTYKLNPAMSGMVVDGCESVANIFSEVYAHDVKNADVDRIQINALAAMRRIRETYRMYISISEDAVTDLKHSVALPLLTRLLAEIAWITTGLFNGESDERFKDLIYKFVKDFIQLSVRYAIK